MGSSREEAHALITDVREGEQVEHAQVPRGSVTIHNERVVHGSGGNSTDGYRRTYVLAFRTEDTVRRERAMGFTHSHNDEVNWDVFNKWQEAGGGGQ